MGEFKIILLLYSCFWIDNAHEHHYQFENLLNLYLNTAIHLLFSKINSKDITNTVQQSVSKYFDVLSKNTQLLHVCFGLGGSWVFSVLFCTLWLFYTSQLSWNKLHLHHSCDYHQPISDSTS